MRVGRATTTDGTYLARASGGNVELLVHDVDDGISDPLRTALVRGDSLATMPALAVVPEDAVQWRAPLVLPEKIIAVGLNYLDHAEETALDLPKAPLLFSKLASCIVGPGEAIRFRADNSQEVDYEVELAVVIGREAEDVRADEALDLVFGYTLANDVSARDAQFGDGQWFRGKNFDTFCPLGPVVVTADELGDPQQITLQTTVNGVVLQDDSTAAMIFTVAELISYVSRHFRLVAGDVILTGTPSGVGFTRSPAVFLQDGDEVVVSSPAIGALANAVVVEATAAAPVAEEIGA